MEPEIEFGNGDLLVQREPSSPETGIVVETTPRTVKIMWRTETKKYKKSECIRNINEGTWKYVAKIKNYKA